MPSTTIANRSNVRLAASCSDEQMGMGAASATAVGSSRDLAEVYSPIGARFPGCGWQGREPQAIMAVLITAMNATMSPGQLRRADYFIAASYILATYSQLTRWSTNALR